MFTINEQVVGLTNTLVAFNSLALISSSTCAVVGVILFKTWNDQLSSTNVKLYFRATRVIVTNKQMVNGGI